VLKRAFATSVLIAIAVACSPSPSEPPAVQSQAQPRWLTLPPPLPLPAAVLTSSTVAAMASELVPPGASGALQELERKASLAALERTQGHKSRAAALLVSSTAA
jgi:hypothetical protein